MRLGLSLALVVLILDQLSKWAVMEQVFKPLLSLPALNIMHWYGDTTRLPFVQVEILPFFNLSMMWNEGIGLGLFGGAGPWVLIALSMAICIFLIVWMMREPQDHYLHMALGLMIGGAIGNVIDRARLGAVIDFIDVHAFGWHYPTFNVADSCIVVGVGLLLLQPLFGGTVKKS